MTRLRRVILPLLFLLVVFTCVIEYLLAIGQITPLAEDLMASIAPLLLMGMGAYYARAYRLPTGVKLCLFITFLLVLAHRLIDISDELRWGGRALLPSELAALEFLRMCVRNAGYGMFFASTLFAIRSFRRLIRQLESNREHAAATSRMLQAVLDTIPVRAFWKNRELRYLGGNLLFAIDAGKLAPEDLVGLNDYDLVSAEEARRYRADDLAVINGEEVKRNYEQEHRRPDGSILWQRASKIPLRDSQGEIVGVLGMYEDITAEKISRLELTRYQEHLEELVHARSTALDRSEERYARAATAGRVGIWEFDFTTQHLFVSDDIKSLIGFAADELEGTIEELLARGHPEDNDALMESVRRYMRGELPRLECEHRALHRDGTWRWFLLTGELERDAEGHPARLMGVDVDITDLKKTEQDLRLAKEQAESAAHAKADFLANMSHEIRTPMNGVMGMAHLLVAAGLPPEQQRRAEVIVHSGETLLSVINDILDFSKIDAGEMRIEVTPMDLKQLVERVSAPHAATATAKGLTLSVAYGADAPRLVFGDPVRTGQVLSNLLNNAVKFTSTGYIHVTVSGSPLPGDMVCMRLAVADSGIGIAPERIGAIFDKFSQADSSTTRRFGGSGLGLTISQRLVELMGGEISVHSQEGTGSTFEVVLPMARAELQAVQAEYPPFIEEDGAQFAILLAEDNLMNLEVARDFLTPFAARLDLAMNGQDAVDLATARTYDLIFMDLHMPKMDGLEATRAIRALPAHTETPIIAMTASVLDPDRQRCTEAGMSDFLPKPLQPREVVEVVLRNTV